MTWGASEESVECGRMRGYRLDPCFPFPAQQEETGLGLSCANGRVLSQ
jgi:hypothetical protein